MKRILSTLLPVLAGVTMLSTCAAASGFKPVNSAKVERLLPARIVVPDHHSPSGMRYVSEDDTFFSFERFRLEVNPKHSGHIYVFARDNDGDFEQLYPLGGDGDNFVHRKQNVMLPFDGWFRFDRHAGQEEMYVIQSATSLGEDDCEDVLDRYEGDPYARQDGLVIRRIFFNHERP